MNTQGVRSDQFTFAWLGPAQDELARLAFQLVDVLSNLPDGTAVLVSCGSNKKKTKSAASELYTSPRFQLSISLARRLKRQSYILSAKHGVLSPSTKIAPYDVSLTSLSEAQLLRWRTKVLEKLIAISAEVKKIVLLLDDDYAHPLSEQLTNAGVTVLNPLAGLPSELRLSFLKECHHYLDRVSGVEELYQTFDQMRADGKIRSLRQTVAEPLPEQGVYFFFDPSESTRFVSALPRLVRVGTHGVSAGSRATLRDRLRTHLGTGDGYGNHRSSVFRLHVGEALIRRDSLRDRFPSWGVGQSSAPSVRDGERDLEQKVTEHISNMLVGCVAVADKAAKESARSLLERLSIALFTDALLPVEAPGRNWLGLHSKHEAIARTGLWNLRDVGTRASTSISKLIRERVLGTGA